MKIGQMRTLARSLAAPATFRQKRSSSVLGEMICNMPTCRERLDLPWCRENGGGISTSMRLVLVGVVVVVAGGDVVGTR